MIKIYYVPGYRITREYRLIQQGLENNPRVKLVKTAKESDFIFHFYYVSKHSKHYKAKYDPEKTVLIDYHDSPRWMSGVPCMAYFKRSWVKLAIKGYGVIKVPISRPKNCYPISFAIMDEFITEDNPKRDIWLTCTLREHGRHLNRVRVLELLESMKIKGKVQIGDLNDGSMRGFNYDKMRDYFKIMKRSRIVVTCNPNPWEGDHRTWEAFASGALVFIDRMFTPIDHPLIDGKHCIFYDISGPGFELLQEKIKYYIDNPAKAAAIAKTGYDFTMKYHRTSSRIDDILRRIT